jgi:photosystem II stability/assembly factor-like uncharacterized protein
MIEELDRYTVQPSDCSGRCSTFRTYFFSDCSESFVRQVDLENSYIAFPKVNTSKWRSIALPFRPYNVTAFDGTLWVCGLNETIAVSNDRGISWRIQHQRQDGEVLLKIAFIDQNTGHAAGTGGIVLSTTNGGQTWSSHSGDSTIDDFSFSGPNDGIAKVGGHASLTSDGGVHWQEISAMMTDPKIRQFSQIELIAALSTTHYAIAAHQEQGENIIVSTTDGGKSWTPTHIVNTFAGTLLTPRRRILGIWH